MLANRAFTARRPSVGLASRSRSSTVTVRAAVAAQPVKVTVKSADGAVAGSEELALGVAPPTTAKGLVHRYLVYVQQNARQVRLEQACVVGRVNGRGCCSDSLREQRPIDAAPAAEERS